VAQRGASAAPRLINFHHHLTAPAYVKFLTGNKVRDFPNKSAAESVEVLEVGYVGSKGIHQANTASAVTYELATAANPIWGVTTRTLANEQERANLLGFGADNLLCSCTNGNTRFNSLQVTLRKQLSHGLMMQAAYTWSRAFSDFAGVNGMGAGMSNAPLFRSQDWGLNNGYRPQRLVINYNYNIPNGGANGLLGKITGGWSVSGVTTIQDGTPLTVTDALGGTIYGSPASSRAEMAPGATYASILTPGNVENKLNNYLNAQAFSSVPAVNPNGSVTSQAACPSCGTGWGNSGVGVALGPGQFNWDISLAKTTRVGGIRESGVLQFRAEFFNAFNHAQFGNPSTTLNQGPFGLITTTTVNPRLVQFALKYLF
jgi:hypothetical protein